MKSMFIAAVAVLMCVSPATAQQPTATPPTVTKAIDAAGNLAGRVLGSKDAQAPKPALVDINKASATELDALPQIGAARTKSIIAGRPYKSAHELVEKKILSQAVYDQIKDKVAVK